MRILPVLDLMDGQVVHGVAGRRQDYRPIVSRLTHSPSPFDVANAFRRHLGLDELYLADLNAIAGAAPAVPLFTQLLQHGFRLWIDAGVADSVTDTLPAIGVQHVIAGLESLSGPGQLRSLIETHGSSRLVFSLDLHDGRPLASDAWHAQDAWPIAVQAVQLGVVRMLVLDLAAVGMGHGTPTMPMCARLRNAFPQLQITTGGGVRDVDDLRKLRRCGVDNVLLASALHDGRLTRSDLDEFNDP